MTNKHDQERIANEKKEADDKAFRIAEENKIKAQQTQQTENTQKNVKENDEDEQKVEPVTVKPIKPKKDGDDKNDWGAILGDLKSQLNKVPEEDGTLRFDSPEQATQFFQGQAELGREFICAHVDHEGKLTGKFMFSFGDKNLYEGTLEEIRNKLKGENGPYATASAGDQAKIDNALSLMEKALNIKPNPTQAAKQAMKGLQEESATKKGEQEENTAPSPLPTDLKPR